MVLIPSFLKNHIDMLPNVYNNHNYSPKHNEKMIYCQQAILPPPKRLTLVKLNGNV